MTKKQPGVNSNPGNDDNDEITKELKKQKLKYEVSQEMGIMTKQKYKK